MTSALRSSCGSDPGLGPAVVGLELFFARFSGGSELWLRFEPIVGRTGKGRSNVVRLSVLVVPSVGPPSDETPDDGERL